MKQPKFKFGDMIVMKKSEACYRQNKIPFEIIIIVKSGDKFELHGEDNWIYEDEAELYQEPQKKKLYAYGTETHYQITFYHQELKPCGLSRLPEYDIEYDR